MHDTHLIGAGGVDRALSVFDTRVMGLDQAEATTPVVTGPNISGTAVSWFKYGAHQSGVITDVQWSPFVPFWLASSGDNMVHVWDMRFMNGPVLSIDQHHQRVESVRY